MVKENEAQNKQMGQAGYDRRSTTRGLGGETTITGTCTSREETERKSHCIAAFFRTCSRPILLSSLSTPMAITIHCDSLLPFLYNQPTFPISTLKMEEIYFSKMLLPSHRIHITSHKPVVVMFYKTSQFPSFPLSWSHQFTSCVSTK